MKAIRIHERGGPEVLRCEEVPVPEPAAGEVLVRIRAAGVTAGEIEWYPTWHTRVGGPRPFPVIPGHEFCGEVVRLGEGTSGVAIGDIVFGMNDWFGDGCLAEYTLARPELLVRKPRSLDEVSAAAVPIAALAAWQGLMQRCRLSKGNRVLIHGGAGAIGCFAVQMARWRGAHVIATCSPANEAYVRELGADETIDARAVRFETAAREIDVIVDTVGGETLARSWSVLKPGGRLVTTTNDSLTSRDPRVREAFLIVDQDGLQLEDIAEWIDEGILRPTVDRVYPLEDTRKAFETKAVRGKSVVRIPEARG